MQHSINRFFTYVALAAAAAGIIRRYCDRTGQPEHYNLVLDASVKSTMGTTAP